MDKQKPNSLLESVRSLRPESSSLSDRFIYDKYLDAPEEEQKRLAQMFPDFAQQVRARKVASRPGIMTEIGQQLRVGAGHVTGGAAGLVRMGADLVGADRMSEAAAGFQQRRKETAERLRPSVERVEDIETTGDFFRWLTGMVANQAPLLGTQIAAGLAAEAALPFVPGSGVATFAALRGAPLTRLAGRSRMLARMGGASAPGAGSYIGSIYGDARDEGSEIGQAARGALMGGIPATLVSIIYPAYVGGVISRNVLQRGSANMAARTAALDGRRTMGPIGQRVYNTATQLGIGTVLEGSAEAVAEMFVIEGERIANPNFTITDEEYRSRILNAAAAGAGVGGVMGGVTGVSTRTSNVPVGEDGKPLRLQDVIRVVESQFAEEAGKHPQQKAFEALSEIRENYRLALEEGAELDPAQQQIARAYDEAVATINRRGVEPNTEQFYKEFDALFDVEPLQTLQDAEAGAGPEGRTDLGGLEFQSEAVATPPSPEATQRTETRSSNVVRNAGLREGAALVEKENRGRIKPEEMAKLESLSETYPEIAEMRSRQQVEEAGDAPSFTITNDTPTPNTPITWESDLTFTTEEAAVEWADASLPEGVDFSVTEQVGEDGKAEFKIQGEGAPPGVTQALSRGDSFTLGKTVAETQETPTPTMEGQEGAQDRPSPIDYGSGERVSWLVPDGAGQLKKRTGVVVTTEEIDGAPHLVIQPDFGGNEVRLNVRTAKQLQRVEETQQDVEAFDSTEAEGDAQAVAEAEEAPSAPEFREGDTVAWMVRSGSGFRQRVGQIVGTREIENVLHFQIDTDTTTEYVPTDKVEAPAVRETEMREKGAKPYQVRDVPSRKDDVTAELKTLFQTVGSQHLVHQLAFHPDARVRQSLISDRRSAASVRQAVARELETIFKNPHKRDIRQEITFGEEGDSFDYKVGPYEVSTANKATPRNEINKTIDQLKELIEAQEAWAAENPVKVVTKYRNPTKKSPSQSKKPATKKQASKSVEELLTWVNENLEPPLRGEVVSILLSPKHPQHKTVVSTLNMGMSEEALVNVLGALVEQQGTSLPRSTTVAPSSLEPSPTEGAKRGRKKVPDEQYLTEENLEKAAKIHNADFQISLSNFAGEMGLSQEKAKLVLDEARRQGRLNNFMDRPFNEVLVEEGFEGIVKAETVSSFDEFIQTGSLQRWLDDGGNRHRSRWLAAILDSKTGEVHVRPVVKPNNYKNTELQFLRMSKNKGKKFREYTPDGQFPLEVSLLPEDAQVILLFRYKGEEPTNKGFDFTSEEAFNRAYENSPEVASSLSEGDQVAFSEGVEATQADPNAVNPALEATKEDNEWLAVWDIIKTEGITEDTLLQKRENPGSRMMDRWVHSNLPSQAGIEPAWVEREYARELKRIRKKTKGTPSQKELDSIYEGVLTKIYQTAKKAHEKLSAEEQNNRETGRGRGDTTDVSAGTGTDAVAGNEASGVSGDNQTSGSRAGRGKSPRGKGKGRKQKPSSLSTGEERAATVKDSGFVGPGGDSPGTGRAGADGRGRGRDIQPSSEQVSGARPETERPTTSRRPRSGTPGGLVAKPPSTKQVANLFDWVVDRLQARSRKTSDLNLPLETQIERVLPDFKAFIKKSPMVGRTLIKGYDQKKAVIEDPKTRPEKAKALQREFDSLHEEAAKELANMYVNSIRYGLSRVKGNQDYRVDAEKVFHGWMSGLAESQNKEMGIRFSVPNEVADTSTPRRSENQSRPLTEAENDQWNSTVASLKNQGIEVETIARELGATGLTGQQYAWIDIDGVQMRVSVVMDDVTRPNFRNLRSLLHEAVHGALEGAPTNAVEAVNQLALDALNGDTTTDTVYTNPTEALTEAIAKRLQDQGFGAESVSLAQRIVMAVKQAFTRAALAIQKALLGPDHVSESLIFSYFETHVKRFLTGDAAPMQSLPDFLGGTTSTAQQARAAGLAPGSTTVAYTYQGDFITPEVNVIDDAGVEAALANWRFSVPNEALDANIPFAELPRETEHMYESHAKMLEIAELVERLSNDLGVSVTELMEAIGIKFDPGQAVATIQKEVPGAARAVYGQMNKAMNASTADKVYKGLNAYLRRSVGQIERSRNFLEEAESILLKKAETISELQKNPALVQSETIFQSVTKTFKGLRKSLLLRDRTSEDYAVFSEIERILGRSKEGMAAEFEKAFQSMSLPKSRDKVVEFVKAVAALNIDWAGTGGQAVTLRQGWDAITNFMSSSEYANLSPTMQADVAKFLGELNGNDAAKAIIVAFAKGNAMQMDALGVRADKAMNRFVELQKTIDEVRQASDQAIDQMEASIKQTIKQNRAVDRLKAKLIAHEREYRRVQRRKDKTTERIRILEQAVPALQVEIEKWGSVNENLLFEFDGVPGSEFPVMKAERDGSLAEMRTFDLQAPKHEFEKVMSDNRAWLDLNEHQKGKTALYRSVSRAYEIMLRTHVQMESETSRYGYVNRMLQSIQDMMGNTGTNAGVNVQRALFQYQGNLRTVTTRMTRPTGVWAKHYTNLMKALGYKGNPTRFDLDIRDPILHQLNIRSNISEQVDAERLMMKLLTERMSSIAPPKKRKATSAAEIRKLAKDWLEAERAVGEAWDGVREELGIPIHDGDGMAFNPQTGQSGPVVRMKGIPRGYVNTPRSLNFDRIKQVVHYLRDSLNFYGTKRDSIFGKNIPTDQQYWKDSSLTDGEKLSRLERDYQPFLADSRFREDFLEPFFNSEVSLIRDVPSSTVRAAWAESGNSIAQFIENIHLSTGIALDVVIMRTHAAVRNAGNQLLELSRMDEQKGGGLGTARNMAVRHFIIDARTDPNLPTEFFSYRRFDNVSTISFAASLAATNAFGRDGARLEGHFELVIDEIDRKIAKSEPGTKQHRDLSEMRNNVNKLRQKLDHWFNRSDTGPHNDEKLAREMIGFMVTGVLNNPKTALLNFISPLTEPFFTYKSFDRNTVGFVKTAVSEFIKTAGGSLFEALGGHLKPMSQYDTWIAQLAGRLNEAGMDFGEFIADPGRADAFESATGRAVKGLRQTRNALSKGLGLNPFWKGSRTRTPFSPLNMFAWVSTMANYSSAVAQLRMTMRNAEAAFKYMEAQGKANNPNFKLSKADIKSMTRQYKLGSTDTIEILNRQLLVRTGLDLAGFGKMMHSRTQQGQDPLTFKEVADIVQISEDEINLNANVNTRPMWMMTGLTKDLTVLWGWPIRKMDKVNKSFKDETNKFSLYLAGKTLLIMGSYVVPISILYTMLFDLYDEYLRGRAPNLRKMGTDKSLKDNALATVERLGRIGTYGMGGDLLNSVVNWTDYNSGGRTVSMDERVLVMSMFHNFTGAIRNLILQEGNPSYQTVWRPLLNSMGASGAMQYAQMFNQALATLEVEDTVQGIPAVGDFLKAEREFTVRSNVYNILRSAAREAKVPLRAGGGFSMPTAGSMHLREMQFAAYVNDRDKFLNHYRQAVQEYMKQGRTYEEALQTVRNAWGARNPTRSLFQRTPSDSDMAAILAAMPERNRGFVQQALRMHDIYGGMIDAQQGRAPRQQTRRPAPSPLQQLVTRPNNQRRVLTPL